MRMKIEQGEGDGGGREGGREDRRPISHGFHTGHS